MTDTLDKPSELTAQKSSQIAGEWVADLAAALATGSAAAVETLFDVDATWRDFMGFTWDFTHSLGREAVATRLVDLASAAQVTGFSLHGKVTPEVIDGSVYAFFDFDAEDKVGRAFVLLVPGPDRFIARTLQTQVEHLADYPEKTGHNRPEGKVYGVVPNRTRWSSDLARKSAFEDDEPAVLVLGAGHNGLAIAARLEALDVPTLVIDKEQRVGDTWRNRYEALALHSTVFGDHLPYLPMPPTWTAHTPKDKWADWLESYAKLLDLSVWTSTTFIDAEYDEQTQIWTIRVRRGDGSIRVLHPRHFVVAGGMFGSPRIPQVDGLDSFEGEYVHSDAFTRGEDYSGKRALVVGVGVSGHEILHDLWEHGADVTALQRSSTYVVNYETYHKYWSGQFTEDAVFPPEFADQIAYATPNERSDEIQKRLVQLAKEEDRDLLERLASRGFKFEWGPDGTGIIGAHMSGRDSYQINIGASELIADGHVKLKQGVEIAEITNGKTVVFTDGSEIEVDVIVFATGYHQFWGHLKPTLGSAAAKIDKAYGRAADNEYANTWRRSAQPGLWFGTGFIRMARFYTKFMTTLIKAIEVGIEPVDPAKPNKKD